MGPTTRFLLLGPVRAIHDGVPLPAPRPRCRAVLAYLLLNANRPVSAERLIEALWAGRPPGTARAQVQADVSALRRLLRPVGDVIATSTAGYQITVADGGLDVDDFARRVASARTISDPAAAADQLHAALELWRGPALADVVAGFVEPARVRLEEQRLTAEERLAALRLAAGRPDEAVAALLELVAENPYRERLRAHLMLALYRGGRRAEALGVARALRTLLVEHEGIDPGPEVIDLERRILRDDPTLLAPAQTTPAQLPADVSAFTGRVALLRSLDDLLSSATIGVVAGLGGAGKTALVIRWAHRVRESFPDGQLYVNLRGYSGAPPLRPLDALARFLHALGVPADEVPVDEDEAAALYRSRLAGRRMLVVLDNARNADQIRPLLPGTPTCLVIVTSRARLGSLIAHDGARLVTVDSLTPDEAESLLWTLIGAERAAREPAAVAELARLCGHLPLALRIAAALTIRGSISQYVAQFRLSSLDLEDDQSSVRATFGWSYAALPPAQRRLLRLLGLVPTISFDGASAEALAGEPAALGQLADAHLLERLGPQRFGFHDLVRQFAADAAEAEESEVERRAALDRFYGYYLSRADAAVLALAPNHPELPAVPSAEPSSSSFRFVDAAAAVAWIDAELRNLLSIIVHTAHGQPGSASVAWRLGNSLRMYFWQRSRLVEWFTVGRASLTAATRDANPAAEAAAHLSLGDAQLRASAFQASIDHHSRALALSERAVWLEGQRVAMSSIGGVFLQSGHPQEALAWLTRSLDLQRRLNPHVVPASTLAQLGAAHVELARARRDHGDLDAAAVHAARAVEVLREARSQRS